jgi:Putative addiction module component
METALPLDKMTVAEKLRAMEEIWADLSRNESQIESPAWHGDVLREREAKVKSGREKFISWEAAKKQLRKKLA